MGSLDTSELVASTFELVLLLVSATISSALLLTALTTTLDPSPSSFSRIYGPLTLVVRCRLWA